MRSRIFLGALIMGLAGCGVFASEETPPANSAEPAAGDAPRDRATTDGGLPEGAPVGLVGTPASDELTTEFGVFVMSGAAAGGDGTKEHPFATITAGIQRVKDLKLRVYVCAGTYRESLTLVDAVSVVGSLSCDGGVWKTNGGRSTIEAPASPAIRAKDIRLVTRLEGFDVTVPAGTAASPSSIALIAENAPKLAVASCKLTAAKGFDGARGTDGTQLTAGATLNGRDGAASAPPAADPPLTGAQAQLGGSGGVGSCVGVPGHDGENGKSGGNGATEICEQINHLNGAPSDQEWELYIRKGVRLDRSDGEPGSGAAGVSGADGTSAATVGAFTPAGYAAAGGTAGADGAPGHGGSGGNGAPSTVTSLCGIANVGKVKLDASGAGGGAGGCPGLAGSAGGGGGASVAALVFASPGLSFTACQLVAGDGGNGGSGSFPSAPTPGGSAGVTAMGATPAAPGGAGGRGGFSGNGAGGPSVALAHTGGEIVVAPDTYLTAGSGGAGVGARSAVIGGVTVTIPASVGGPSMPILAF